MLVFLCLFIVSTVKTVGSVQEWKISKAMKNNLIEKEERLNLNEKVDIQYGTEEEINTEITKTKSFKKLRKLLSPVYKSDHRNSVTGSANNILKYHWVSCR